LTWRQCANIVLVFMGLGTLIALLMPVWLAPPQFVFCALRRPSGPRRIPVLLLVFGALISTGWCTIGASGLGLSLLVTGNVTCQRESLPQAQVRYTCVNSFIYYSDVYVLEWPDGWPIVRLVEKRSG
jgi:hypothetical protein